MDISILNTCLMGGKQYQVLEFTAGESGYTGEQHVFSLCWWQTSIMKYPLQECVTEKIYCTTFFVSSSVKDHRAISHHIKIIFNIFNNQSGAYLILLIVLPTNLTAVLHLQASDNPQDKTVYELQNSCEDYRSIKRVNQWVLYSYTIYC